jgi:hypothetical protein
MNEITRKVSEAIEKMRMQTVDLRLSVTRLRSRMERLDPKTTTRRRVNSMKRDGLLLADMAVAALDALALLSDQVSISNENISTKMESLQNSSRKALELARKEHTARVAALDLSQRYCDLVSKLEAKIAELKAPE